MIVRTLREKHHWSQEQLAQLSGLSLRTIQRVEAGNKASLETLKALASVLEIDISTLTEEVTVIDKDADYWKAEPIYIRWLLWGVNKRPKEMAYIEYVLVAVGIVSWFVFEERHLVTPLALLFAYISAKVVAYMDSKGYW
ncbi:helix-turn-helix domain-containing protein [Shewanella sedimentimangrovi]|uniref:Helix-turn-helix transcriptional regulator n=1 Tax=Shewanella sedimentimangrovi TaxID=2814293 RepID=A0ABX7R6V5_9GAMM|nr:helix-turn-helix transcriptional regulator [Shewanella sedimentimangrovi]QSX38805.1 helix-turn-helix transcriptional regulator [Shewanella sedimentimangrovi]